MSRMRAFLFAFLLISFSVPIPLTAQQAQLKITSGLTPIMRPAGFIFAGTVRAIQYEPVTASGQVPTVRITFQINEGIRGARTGSDLTIREWAGLWNAGERYHVGERVVLFLYPVSELGLTSPVGASLGRFAVDHSGKLIMDDRQAGMVRAHEPGAPIIQGRIRLRDFTRVVSRRLLEED